MTIYQAPKIEWQDQQGDIVSIGHTVMHEYRIADLDDNVFAVMYWNKQTQKACNIEQAPNFKTLADAKEWVEVTHYPSALLKAGFKPVTNHYDLIKQWAHDRNLINGSNQQAQFVKLIEETGELASGIAKGQLGKIEDSIGDVIVVLTVITAQCGLDIESCIEFAYNEIKDRKGRMIDGVFVKEADL